MIQAMRISLTAGILFWLSLGFIVYHFRHNHHDPLGNAQQFRAEDTAKACAARGGRPLMDYDMEPPVYIVCQ